MQWSKRFYKDDNFPSFYLCIRKVWYNYSNNAEKKWAYVLFPCRAEQCHNVLEYNIHDQILWMNLKCFQYQFHHRNQQSKEGE